jgi:morphogenetic protein associated with SpoVID
VKFHIAQCGDTLYALAERYHVDLRTLVYMNPQVWDPKDIEVGIKIFLPPPKPAEPQCIMFKHQKKVDLINQP